MIAAALGAVVAVLVVVAQRDLETRRAEIRTHGAALANTLARVPLERLVPSAARATGLLDSIGRARNAPDFAYAVVVDREGRTLAEVSRPDWTPPAFPPPPLDPSGWNDERQLTLAGLDGIVRQFSAPVLEAGELVAQTRVGYVEPSLTLGAGMSAFDARIALVVLLLLPMAALWLRSELRPLQAMARELGPGTVGAGQGVAGAADVERLVSHFRSFSEDLESRAADMDRERLALVASTKVLAHQKNRGELALEALPDGVLLLDQAGAVVLSNPRASSTLRIAREELSGVALSSWSPAPEVTALVQRQAGRSDSGLRSEKVEFTLGEGHPRTFLANLRPLSDQSGFLLVLRDVSEERAARETQAEFLGHMAHELKAPLNVIGLYRESLLMEGEDEAARVEACNVIGDEVDRLNGLIGNIFSISRIENGVVDIDRQRIRLRELLVDTFESASRDGRQSDLEFELDVPDTLSPIFADKQLMSIAVKNLLTNAIKYNRSGGRVGLRAVESEEGLSIEISDTGVGIPPEEVELVFDKFYRSEGETARKVAGHGLGLALVKEIVGLHGGEIQVRSELGEGSTFTLFFGEQSAIAREEF